MIKKCQVGSVIAIIFFMVFLSLIFLSRSNHSAYKENSFEYEDDYAYSILYSILRSTTNSSDIRCRTTKDLSRKLFMPGIKDTYCCEIYDKYCYTFINDTLTEKLNKINKTFKKSYIFYFDIVLANKKRGERIYYEYGNKTLKICKGNKISAVEQLPLGTKNSKAYAQVIIIRRGDLCLK